MSPEAWIGLVGVSVAVLGGLLGYYTHSNDQRMGDYIRTNDQRMENSFKRIEQAEAALIRLPDIYARRDDFKDLIRDVFTKLDRIEEKLDKKADK